MKQFFLLLLVSRMIYTQETLFERLKERAQKLKFFAEKQEKQDSFEKLKKETKDDQESIEKIVLRYAPEEIKLIVERLKNPRKKRSSFGILFTGKSAVGKTTMAIAMAKEVNIPYHVFDMQLNKDTGYYGKLFKKRIMPLLESNEQQIIILENIHSMINNSENPSAYMAVMALLDRAHYKPHITIISTCETDKDFPDPLKSRLPRGIKVPLPSLQAREDIINYHLSLLKHNCKQELIKLFAQSSEGKTAKEIEDMINFVHFENTNNEYDLLASDLSKVIIAETKNNPSFITKVTQTAAGIGIVALVIAAVWKIIKYLEGTVETKSLSTITKNKELENASQTRDHITG